MYLREDCVEKGKQGNRQEEQPGKPVNCLSHSGLLSIYCNGAVSSNEPPEGWVPPLIFRLSEADLEDRCLEELDQAAMTGRRSSE